jgi:predicted nucleic acid-binding protein
VIDTDVLIDHFHNVQAATDYIARSLLADGELFISSVSVAEILAGMRPGEEELTEALFDLFTVQPADEEVARIAGAYLHLFARTYRLELGDALIAATAKILGAELITRNTRHYPMTDIIIREPYSRGRR